MYNLIHIQAIVRQYLDWLDRLLHQVNYSIYNSGNVNVYLLDKDTLSYTIKTVETIKQSIENIKTQLNTLSDNVPSLNVFPDVNFDNTSNWSITGGSGSISITSITSNDKDQLYVLTGRNFNLVNGITNKLVVDSISGLNPRLVYADSTCANKIIKSFFTLGGFVKLNDTTWQYMPLSMIPDKLLNVNACYEILLKGNNKVELIYPYVLTRNLLEN